MHIHSRIFAGFVVAIALHSQSLAKKKTENLQLFLSSVDGCDRNFSAEQEPDPYLTRLEPEKRHGIVGYRRKSQVIDHFPDDIDLTVYYGFPDDLSLLLKQNENAKGTCKPFDPRQLRFTASWTDSLHRQPASGALLKMEYHEPQAMCETTCHSYWTYTLRVDSREVPLTEKLSLTISTDDGTIVSKLEGRLEPVEPTATPARAP